MEAVEFLELADVLAIHIDQTARYGGDNSIRDLQLLESALAQPRAGSGDRYFHSFPFGMAAAYLFHIVKNHPFADGNKRTAAVAALVFLDWNGVEISAEPGELAEMTLDVVAGNLDKSGVASWFENHQMN